MSLILSSLGPKHLAGEVQKSQYAKWATTCLMRHLGLQTLNTALVGPDENADEVAQTARTFAKLISKDRLLVRSDAPTETRAYYRGGNTYVLDKAIQEAEALHQEGRAVLFLEPTNRFNNLLTVTFVMDRDSGLQMEVLGPGFDVSDLNRGGITPELSVQVNNVDWRQFEIPRAWDYKVRRHDTFADCQNRRMMRLTRMAEDILPRLGVVPKGDIGAAERWLKEQGHLGIWSEHGVKLSLRLLQKLYEDMFMIVDHLWSKPWKALGCSASDLGDGRFVYWDIVFPTRKFGML